MKKFFAASLLLSSLSTFAATEISTAVSLDIKTINSPDFEYCVVQILQPEVEGYKFYDGTSGRGPLITNGTLQNFLTSHGPFRPSTRTSEYASKSIKTKAIIRNLSDDSSSVMERVVSANVSYEESGMNDHSVLSLNNLMPYASEVNAALLFMPSAIDGVINKWNDVVNSARDRRVSRRNRESNKLTDLKVVNALNVIANAELILLSQYACEDKKDAIQKVEISRYLNKLSDAFSQVIE